MLRWPLAVLVAATIVAATEACPLGFRPPPTFRQEAKLSMARVILVGTIANPRMEGNSGRTDFLIQKTLRDDPVMKGVKSVVIENYVPVEKKNPPQYVLFCDVTKGKVDPYRGFRIERADSVEYFRKVLARNPEDSIMNLVFFFGYLDHADQKVAEDAFRECSLADDTAIIAAARKLNAGKIRKWLADPETPLSRAALYAKLLAAVGTPKDASLLVDILDGRGRDSAGWIDEILVGYIMLDPKKGWAYTVAILGNSDGDFPRCYAAVRALRQVAASRTGVVTNRQITAAYRLLLAQEEMLDIPIEEMRDLKRWDMAEEILAIYNIQAHKWPLLKRAMLRYALQCKGNTAATAYVDARRKADPEAVADALDQLDKEAAEIKKAAEEPK